MQAGKLRHRITLESLTQVQGTGGKLVDTWTPVPQAIRIPAEVLPDRAGEFFAAAQVQATTNALIRMRHLDGVVPTMRAIHHIRPGVDEYYDIEGVVAFQSRLRELRLMCIKRDAEGWRRGTDLKNASA